MTAETDLPINDAVLAPTKIEPGNLFLWNWRQMQVYAQACVAHATASKDAEIEALRAEVERVTCELMDAITRADKLAEALREAQPFIGWSGSYPELHAKIDALLRDQEEGQ
jgi:hypothetical protein